MEPTYYTNQNLNETTLRIPKKRLIGRSKVAFLFFLTRLILISSLLQFSESVKTDLSQGSFSISKRGRKTPRPEIPCNIFEKLNTIHKLNAVDKFSMISMKSLKQLSNLRNLIRFKYNKGSRNYKNRNFYKCLFVKNLNEPQIDGGNIIYGSQFYAYSPSSYENVPSYNGSYGLDESNTFVSNHYRNMGEDIVEYLNRKKIEYNESPVKYTLKFCPFCPPHRFKSDNLYKHEIFKNSGNSYCHRCGYKGSLFDFKAHMGDLPGAFDIASDPITNPFGAKKVQKDPDVTITDVNKFEDNLYNNPEYACVLEYLTKTRGLKTHVLKKYHVGAGTFKFKSVTGKLEPEKCVVFPWLSTPHKPYADMGDDVEIRDESEGFDYNREYTTDKLNVNRIKIRSIYDKSKIKILPRGGTWGMFGGHLIQEALEKDSIVLSEGELDAMSIFQETGRITISLPNGANSLPLALLPKLEKFNEIYLWMDFDAPGQSSISHFANKLGIQRVKIVHPLNTPSTTGTTTTGTTTTGAGTTTKGTKSTTTATPTSKSKMMKDANEVLLSGGVDMNNYFKNATVMTHSQILTFNDIKQLVYNELSDPVTTCGIKSITMPGLSNLLKGHRRGELTVWTGSTGSGKTTLLSQLSLDYCLQGVSTLWGSFEINNVRLAKTMLRQFSGRNLENSLNEFDYYANKFNELPLRFLKFHGSTNIDIVLDAMDYAVYVYDVQHIIIDNLQFMLSNYSGPSQNSSYGGYSSTKDVYELQNRTIEKFRRFVTNKNIHLSLVVHPRKEADGIQLGLSSVFGSVKSTQEADNVIILQNILNESRCIDVKKNRFAGLLGRVYFKFDPVSLTAQEFKVTEYLNEYTTNNFTKAKVKKDQTESPTVPSGAFPINGGSEVKSKVSLSNFKINLPQVNSTNLSTEPMNIPITTSTMMTEDYQSRAVPASTTTNYRERERNNLGLTGIDLLNLKPVSQYVNKIIQQNYSTTSNGNQESGDSSTKQDSTESSGVDLTKSNMTGTGDNSNSSGKGRKKSSKSDPVEEEYLSMRGLKISKSSTIKEMRDFVKKNGLGELVKTAGKGIKKEAIYENIRSTIPQSAVVNTKQTEKLDASGESETVETIKVEDEGSPKSEVHSFGVSTSKSLLKLERINVVPNNDIDEFKLKYLSKLPKSLYKGESQPPSQPEKVASNDQPPIPVDVYYSVNYDPLLIDGIIYVDSYEKLESLKPLFKDPKAVGVDIETTGLDHNTNQIRLVQLSVPNQPSVIIDLFKLNTNNPESDNVVPGRNELIKCEWLKNLFKSKDTVKVFHNGKFDINFLRVYGFEFEGPIFDTMVASKLLVASRYISCKLTHVSERYLNIVLDKTQQYSDWSTLQLFEEQLLYSARDSFVLLPLYVILEHLLKINNLADIASVENKCILATSDMELNGIKVDEDKLRILQDELKQEHQEISNDLYSQLNHSEINLNSQKQVLEKLQELKIMDRSKKKIISDTSESTLIRNMSNPIISSLREYRKANKALTAFTQKLPNHINPITKRIYPNYNQLGAESGRFSCDGPNLQQVPRDKKFRECFVAPKGSKFVIADFSQIELRIAAEIANDPKMIQAYQQNVDLHSLTASILKNKSINEVNKEERQLAKAVNFGLIFGMSINGLRMYAETGYNLKLTQTEAKEIYTSFFNNFKGILNWHNSVKNSRPTMVRTLGNRLSVFESFSFTRSLNYPVQGTSADITKETMARLVDSVKPLNAKIIICVHDEIILEVPEDNAEKALKMLIDTMVKSGEKYLKKVPVEAMGSIGDSWADKS
ncbi:DNA polymerase i, putative [Theileria annulata]|uniref:DNA polymerase i, putative n=1 Tax=Theileria annulata TaxID=5874 RepID=Q4UGW4_THEAN|nr:DNA polymerase i, putative [Theileria annulata]CAI73675.1 DNA polymerase i, putative [Theileria annulata]|eukprot:XP_954352.1 DNA polymerase i, putative [Theileria annulata]